MAENDDLDARKALISEKYLGRAGIHAVGLARSKEAVKLYVDSEGSADLQDLLETIREEASPYRVLVIREDRAKRG